MPADRGELPTALQGLLRDPLRAVDNSPGSPVRGAPIRLQWTGARKLHRPACRDAIDAAFWSIATWFPLAIGLMVQEQAEAPAKACGMVLALFLVRMLKACGVTAAWPIASIGLRVMLGASVGYAFGGI